jgi:chromosome transmission fidelity protein 18
LKLAATRTRSYWVRCNDRDTRTTTNALADAFSSYPTKPFQDDTFLSKPNSASKWLNFHDRVSSLVYASQEWELGGYLASPVLAFHDLFASSARRQFTNPTTRRNGQGLDDEAEEDHPFMTMSGPFIASEQTKANRAALEALRSSLSLPLLRVFRSPEALASELLPPILRMLSPDVQPVVINMGAAASGGNKHASTATVRKASERELVARSVNAMIATGVRFERTRIEDTSAMSRSGGFVFRMEPGLDSLARFETAGKLGGADDRVRFGVRQVLDAEVRREEKRRAEADRKRRGGVVDDEETTADQEEEQISKEQAIKAAGKKAGLKRDFFGRIISTAPEMEQPGHRRQGSEGARKRPKSSGQSSEKDSGRIWVSYHEGFSNAVRKPITLKELMAGF